MSVHLGTLRGRPEQTIRWSPWLTVARTEGGRDANYANSGDAETTTAEIVKMTLPYEGNNVREVYSILATPGARGDRSHGIDAVVCDPHGRVGNRVPGWLSGKDPGGQISSMFTLEQTFHCLLCDGVRAGSVAV
jgi:hypothetical protein